DILISFGSCPKNRTIALEHQAFCCLWLIKAMYQWEHSVGLGRGPYARLLLTIGRTLSPA
ncbi:hypothetical protein, partial [Sinorhizobium meliloti]|uniref:hypothetical protein n=1 Tax=Rhizobium meliloti TaxID=382 RepID=UPI001AECF5C2